MWRAALWQSIAPSKSPCACSVSPSECHASAFAGSSTSACEEVTSDECIGKEYPTAFGRCRGAHLAVGLCRVGELLPLVLHRRERIQRLQRVGLCGALIAGPRSVQILVIRGRAFVAAGLVTRCRRDHGHGSRARHGRLSVPPCLSGTTAVRLGAAATLCSGGLLSA